MAKFGVVLFLILGVCFPTLSFGQTAVTVTVEVSSPVPAGSPIYITVRVVEQYTGSPAANVTGGCSIIDSSATTVDSNILFATDTNGYAFLSASPIFQLGGYTAVCTSDLMLGSYNSGTGLGGFQVIAGACTGTDATTVANSNNPYWTEWHFDLNLTPDLSSSPNSGGNESGYGLDGHPQSTFDCNGNALSINAEPPREMFYAIYPRLDNGIDAAWIITNWNYVNGSSCASGYCNGYQSLDRQEYTLDVNFTFYCY